MRKVIKWNFFRITRDWKTRVLALLFFVFFASFSLLYRQQNVTFPAVEMSEEYQDERQIYRLIPKSHFETDLGQEVQAALGSNSVSLGVNRYILSKRSGNRVQGIELLPDYIENGRKIVENNLFLHQAKNFESYDLLTEVYLPPLEEVEEEERFYDELEKSGLDIEWNPYSATQMLKVELELLTGISLFLFISILAADQFSKDQEKNWSLTQGLPISWKIQWRLRMLILGLLFWGTFVLGIMISYFASLQVETAGSFNYPTAIYQNGQIDYIPLWQYLIITALLVFFLSYVILLVTTGLSWIFRNIYVTMLAVSGLFLLPTIWSFVPAFSSWQPSLYLNIFNVLRGTAAQNTELMGIVWWKGLFVFVLLTLMVEWVFGRVFSYIPTKTAGLKRREGR